MARSRKSEKLILAWKILTQEAKKNPLPGNNPDVWEPLDRLVIQGQMSRGTAGQCLTKFEKAGYLTKHTNGTVRLLFVSLRNLEDLGEDILSTKEEVSSPQAKPPQSRSEDDQGEAATPPAEDTEDTAKPQKHDPVDRAVDAKKDASDDVIVVYDYENLKYTLEDEGAVLDFRNLITNARQFGNVLLSKAFIPPHTSQAIQGKLRLDGFRIETCPPRKNNGPDTCDLAIEEFVRFCLDYTSIGTFVLISGDGDFIDIVDEIENNGRKCVVFHYNYGHANKVLLSRTGNVINLASREMTPSQAGKRVQKLIDTATPALANSSVSLEYNQILDDLENGTAALGKNDPCYMLLRAIVSCLKETDIASEEPGCRKSFSRLEAKVWQKISGDFKLIEEPACRRALSALRDFSVIESRSQQKNREAYYVFNSDHPLVAAILGS